MLRINHITNLELESLVRAARGGWASIHGPTDLLPLPPLLPGDVGPSEPLAGPNRMEMEAELGSCWGHSRHRRLTWEQIER